MKIELISDDILKKESNIYIKGIKLVNNVRLDYATDKHSSFLVDHDGKIHNVMYFSEKNDMKRWQCDCKWYTLHDKICSHIIAVNLALRDKKIVGV